MAIYYHVSTELTHSGKFEPRIPDNRHKESEDSETPRVCVAPTIEDCLTAIPMGGMMLDELCMEMRNYFLVFKIDTEKIGISEADIVSSQTLFEKDIVRDAEMTSEHWITVPFTVPEEDRFIISISSWDEEPYDVIPFSIYEIADKEFEGDYLDAYEAIYNDFIPCSTQIKDIKYITENIKKGNGLRLYFNCNKEEKNLVVNYIKEYKFPLMLSDESIDELFYVAEEEMNLKNLFLYHYKIAQLC